MLQIFRKFAPSPAMIVALIALFVALGGTAAALSGSNTVFSDDIVNGEVYSGDVRNDTLAGGGLGASDLRSGSVGSAEVLNDSASGGGLAAADLRPGSVRSSEVSDNSLTGDDIANAASGSDNVNADMLDGLDSSQLEGARAYGWGGGGDCDLFGTKPNPVFCPIHSNNGIAYIVRVATGTYCVGVDGINPAGNVALVSVEWSGTKLPIGGAYPPGNTAAMWKSSNSACVSSEFEIKTERQYPATASGSGGGSVPVSQPAVPSSDVAFVIAIP